ncbi:MAG: stage 0 sporulation family protein [Actinobacteria bacterium]|nr:stage 0 sporulation family protein [Actinomycetota bacterium]
MPEVAEVVFRNGCKVYSFDPAGLELDVADQVIVRTSRGIEIGKVVVANHELPPEEVVAPLEKVVRKATDSDLSAVERNEKLAVRVGQVCEEKISDYGLDMRLINTEVVFDGGKIIISFFAEERVDFRRLVEDLAKKFRTRIEFRQVGVRDEARLIGGYGPCGRRMCCTMFAGDQQPVSIKMAKEQNLPLNPMKISGICGRLMCCLKYEQEAYKDFKCRCPNKGTVVMTDKGEGRVVDYLVPKEKVLVNLGEAGQTEASLEEIKAASERPREAAPVASEGEEQLSGSAARPRGEAARPRSESDRSRGSRPRPDRDRSRGGGDRGRGSGGRRPQAKAAAGDRGSNRPADRNGNKAGASVSDNTTEKTGGKPSEKGGEGAEAKGGQRAARRPGGGRGGRGGRRRRR